MDTLFDEVLLRRMVRVKDPSARGQRLFFRVLYMYVRVFSFRVH
jgi:hypothetical protein